MYQPFLTFLSPLLLPSYRVRIQCLLLLLTLVFGLIYLGSRPNVSAVFPYLPWDKLVHAIAYAGFAALSWVALGGQSHVGAVSVAGAIGLLDEWVQYYSPGRTADFQDLLADLVGAAIIVFALRGIQASVAAQRLVRTRT